MPAKLSQLEQIRLQNIDNNKTLRELGLPVSQRKFDRHVPHVSTAASDENPSWSDDSASSDSEEEENNEKIANQNTELMNGEEVYLMKNGNEIFKARYEETQGDLSTVHGDLMQPGEGRFFITKVMRCEIKWKDFESDKMCEGAAILWNKEQLEKEIYKF